MSTIPQILIDQARRLWQEVEAAQVSYDAASSTFERLKASKMVNPREVSIASSTEHRTWDILKQVKDNRDNWLYADGVWFTDTQITNGEATRLLRAIRADRQCAYGFVETMAEIARYETTYQLDAMQENLTVTYE